MGGAVLPRSLKVLSEATDPKAALVKAVGRFVNDVEPFGAQLLVGTYIEPTITKGGIFVPDRSIQESLYQGCLGLVLKKGPWAFQDDEQLNIHWKGQDVDVGDWVVFRYSDAWEQHLNGVSVRFVDDRDIRGRVSDPTVLTSRPNDVAAA